jgi:hypothetical protein
MRFLPKLGCRNSSSRDCEGVGAVEKTESTSSARDEQQVCGEQACAEESHLLKTIGWVSAALGAVALGLIVGREIRQRYKFNRRTPYDLYAHSGDKLPDGDCSVGI